MIVASCMCGGKQMAGFRVDNMELAQIVTPCSICDTFPNLIPPSDEVFYYYMARHPE